uniref:Bestrophin homolog n=1 Tax=Timema poppense TaxID=170557 RepID=A0A7R9CZP9_TIMPO|nr:unnamed protein product [Timema poppensis]
MILETAEQRIDMLLQPALSEVDTFPFPIWGRPRRQYYPLASREPRRLSQWRPAVTKFRFLSPRIMHSIALYIDGNDDHGRMIRRTLMRYLNVTLILVLRSISSAVKRRFPTLEHLVESVLALLNRAKNGGVGGPSRGITGKGKGPDEKEAKDDGVRKGKRWVGGILSNVCYGGMGGCPGKMCHGGTGGGPGNVCRGGTGGGREK